MQKLKDAVARLAALLTPPNGSTNETKIFKPLPEDPNAALKTALIGHASRAIRLGHAAIESNAVANVQLLENGLFLQLDGLPSNDAEKGDYFELVNSTQAVLVAINALAA